MKRLLVILTLAIPALAQDDGRAMRVEYDRFKDRTNVDSRFMQLTGARIRGLACQVFSYYPGQTRQKPAAVLLWFHHAWSEPKLRDSRELILIIDGERESFGQLKMVNIKYLRGGTYLESIGLETDMGLIRRLAHASTVEGRLGSIEFRLTAEHRAAMRELIDYYEQGA